MDAQLVGRARQGDEVALAINTQQAAGRFKQVANRILRDLRLSPSWPGRTAYTHAGSRTA